MYTYTSHTHLHAVLRPFLNTCLRLSTGFFILSITLSLDLSVGLLLSRPSFNLHHPSLVIVLLSLSHAHTHALQAYTIEGDEVSFGRFYSNKFRPMGIIKASVEDAIR